MRFDLLIKGGHVLDAAAGRDGRMDVAIVRDRIAAVAPSIPAEAAFRVIDATGQYVSPGLVDMHAHVFHRFTAIGIDAENHGSRSGVTTWIDAGSVGGYTLPGFREFVVDRSRVRIRAFLNISATGLVAHDYELAHLEYCNTRVFEIMANSNRDLVLGVKVRMGIPQYDVLGIEPLVRARAMADACALPLMVHIAWSPPALEDVLPHLRPGDIITHCFTGLGMTLIDGDGRLRDEAKRVIDAGVVLDVGHGSGSYSFATAEAMLAEGYPPHVISTDSHQHSVQGPMFDLPTCMSKMWHLGMPLVDVFAAATIRPAEVVGLAPEVGTLKDGAVADVALFAVDEGEFPLFDFSHDVRHANRLLRNTATIVSGRELSPAPPALPAPWFDINEAQRAYHQARQGAPRVSHADYLDRPDHFGEPTPAERDATPLDRER
jgi:dihydroorotase